jgi:hypothetical protein
MRVLRTGIHFSFNLEMLTSGFFEKYSAEYGGDGAPFHPRGPPKRPVGGVIKR